RSTRRSTSRRRTSPASCTRSRPRSWRPAPPDRVVHSPGGATKSRPRRSVAWGVAGSDPAPNPRRHIVSDTLTAPTETAPRTLTLEELDALPVGAIVLLTKNLDGRTEAAVKTASRASGYARSAWRM